MDRESGPGDLSISVVIPPFGRLRWNGGTGSDLALMLVGPFSGGFNACRIPTDVTEVKILGKADCEPNQKPKTTRDLPKTGMVFSPTTG